jgi:hypothetical protein
MSGLAGRRYPEQADEITNERSWFIEIGRKKRNQLTFRRRDEMIILADYTGRGVMGSIYII